MFYDIGHILRMIVAAGMCTGTLAYAFTRRQDGSRRSVFLVGGIVCAILTAATLTAGTETPFGSTTRAMGLAGGMILVALIGLILGWRGKRVGDHPYCRKCGFDLFGRPEGSSRCSECGADLGFRRSIVVGERRRRRAPVIVAIFALVLSGMIGGRPTARFVEETNFQQYKPVWWLLWEMDSTSRRSRAESTLNSRLYEYRDSKKLPVSDVNRIARYVLKEMDAGRTTSLFDGLLYQARYLHGECDEPTLRGLLRHIPDNTTLELMPLLTRDRDVEFRFYSPVLNDTYWYADVRMEVLENRFGDQAIGPRDIRVANASLNRLVFSPKWPDIPDGLVTFSRRVEFVVSLQLTHKLIEERVLKTLSAPAHVVKPEDAYLRQIAPNVTDDTHTWTAEYDPRLRTFSIARPSSGTRVLARIWHVVGEERKLLGIADVADHESRSKWITCAPMDDSVKGFRIEVIPAPDLGVGKWDRSPIMDRTIVIHKITPFKGVYPLRTF